MEGAGKRKRVPSTKYAAADWDTSGDPVGPAHPQATQPTSSAEDQDSKDPGELSSEHGKVQSKRHKAATTAARAAAPKAPQQQAPRLTPRQRRQQQLSAALAERGLQLRSDSRLCAEFIETGSVLSRSIGKEQQLAYIVNTMDKMRFYFAYTKYEDYRERVISEELAGRGRFDRDEVSEIAQDYALEEWCSRFNSVAEAAARPELPASLVNKVLQLHWPIEPEDTEPMSDTESFGSVPPSPEWSEYEHRKFVRGKC